MAALGIVLVLLVPLGIIGAIGAVVYFLVKGKESAGDGLSFRNLLRAYLRFAYLVSLVVFLVGAVFTLTSAFSYAFGHDFSYDKNTYYATQAAVPCKVDPSASPSSNPTGVPCEIAPAPQSPPDQRPQDDLIRGISMVVAGLVLGGGHRFGQLAMETASERRRSTLARAESLVATVGFGITSIVAIPLASYDLLRYAILGSPVPGVTPEVPGPALAVALVFGPAWALYLLSFVRAARDPGESTPA